MSHWTTQVRWIVEQMTPGFEGTWQQRIEAACPKIFNFSFPIWEESYRTTLEAKILRHYFTREIGMETVGLWKFELETTLNEIMPYYNKLYETTTKEYNYLWDTNITETFDANETGNEKAVYDGTETGKDNTTETSSADTEGNKGTETVEAVTGTDEGTSNSVGSDFPQAAIAPEGNYASDQTKGATTGHTTSDTTQTVSEGSTSHGDSSLDRDFTTNRDKNSTNTVDHTTDNFYEKSRTGASGSVSLTELINQYRQSLLNIDMLVIADLADLFMQIY